MSLRKKLFFVLLLWVLLDLFSGAVVAWKITRTEAWVRVGDPELHHSLRRMSHQTEQYGPIQGQIFINSLGAKDEACREVLPRVSMPRVAVFGDSFAEGWGIPFSATVTGQLRRLLAPQGLDVLGFGVSSHCPSLTERWMRKLIRDGVRWDLALLLIDPGDSYDEKEVRSFLEGRTNIRKNNKPQFFRLRWYEYSLSYQLFRLVQERLHPRKSDTFDLKQAVRGNGWKVTWLDNPEATPWFKEGLEQSALAVLGMKKIAVQQGFTLAIVIYPYPKMMAENRLQNPYTEFWGRFARENKLPLVDLAPLFDPHGQTAEKIYLENFIPGDFHWNAQGSTRIADTLLPFILKNLNAYKPFPDTFKKP